jgi:hypothetical protein
MKRLLFILSMAFATLAQAAPCLPGLMETQPQVYEGNLGTCLSWFCPDSSVAKRSGPWRLCATSENRLPWLYLAQKSAEIASAFDRLAAFNAAAEAARVAPVTPRQVYEYAELRWLACMDAKLSGVRMNEAICGKEPVEPPAVWLVAPNIASTTTPPSRPMWSPDGTKAMTTRAVVGAECACPATPLVKNTQTLCPLAVGGSPNLAYCVKQ